MLTWGTSAPARNPAVDPQPGDVFRLADGERLAVLTRGSKHIGVVHAHDARALVGIDAFPILVRGYVWAGHLDGPDAIRLWLDQP